MLRFGDLIAESLPNPAIQFIDGLARTPLSKVVWFLLGMTLLRLLLTSLIHETPRHMRDNVGPILLRVFAEGVDAVIYAIGIVFLLLRPFAVQSFYIPSESMVKTLLVNDFIIANKAVYRVSQPKRGDIVVFRPPNDAFGPGETHQDFIKRLIGVPGDIIEIKNGRLYRNGQIQIEPYVASPMDFDFKFVREGEETIPVSIWGDRCNYRDKATADRYMVDFDDVERQQRLIESPPAPIPPGYYFMMGDNRKFSSDSRTWGLVPRASLIGRSEFIFVPLQRIRSTR